MLPFLPPPHSDATTEEDMRYMVQPSQVHVGDSVNVFRHGEWVYTPISAYHTPTGSLVMEHPGLTTTPILGKPVIFGTVFGAIGKNVSV